MRGLDVCLIADVLTAVEELAQALSPKLPCVLEHDVEDDFHALAWAALIKSWKSTSSSVPGFLLL